MTISIRTPCPASRGLSSPQNNKCGIRDSGHKIMASIILLLSLLLASTSSTVAASHHHHTMTATPTQKQQKSSPPPPTMGKQMGTVITPNVPSLGYTLDGDVKVFTLIAQPIKQVFTDYKSLDETLVPPENRFHQPNSQHHHHDAKTPRTVNVWGYNGSMSGPTIELTEGDKVRVIFKNELPEPSSIHWHGLTVPNDQDGSGGTTEAPTLPGETHVYEFTVQQNGTFMYHSGFNMMKQDGLGLGGLVVVHPKNETNKPDKEFAIMLQEWHLTPGDPNPDVGAMEFNWFTMNGKAAPSIETLTVNEGDHVRIRLANLSMQSHPMHLHGYTWQVTGTEGGAIPIAAQWPGSTINVEPGTTRDVEFIASNPGIWRFHCHRLHHIMNGTHHTGNMPMGVMPTGGMFTLLNVVPKSSHHKE